MTPEAIAFQSTPIITFGYLVQVFVSLIIVVAFIYLIGKYLLPRLKSSTSSKIIQILDRVYLEPQVSAYILKVAKTAWLIVVSNKQVAKIDKIEEEI